MTEYMKRYGLEADWQGWLTKAGERVAYKIDDSKVPGQPAFIVVWVDPTKREMVLNPTARKVTAAGTKATATFTLTCEGNVDPETVAGRYLAQDRFRDWAANYIVGQVDTRFHRHDEEETDAAGAEAYMRLDSVSFDRDSLTIESDFSVKIQGTATYEYAVNSEYGADDVRWGVEHALTKSIEDNIPGAEIDMDRPVTAMRFDEDRFSDDWVRGQFEDIIVYSGNDSETGIAELAARIADKTGKEPDLGAARRLWKKMSATGAKTADKWLAHAEAMLAKAKPTTAARYKKMEPGAFYRQIYNGDEVSSVLLGGDWGVGLKGELLVARRDNDKTEGNRWGWYVAQDPQDIKYVQGKVDEYKKAGHDIPTKYQGEYTTAARHPSEYVSVSYPPNMENSRLDNYYEEILMTLHTRGTWYATPHPVKGTLRGGKRSVDRPDENTPFYVEFDWVAGGDDSDYVRVTEYRYGKSARSFVAAGLSQEEAEEERKENAASRREYGKQYTKEMEDWNKQFSTDAARKLEVGDTVRFTYPGHTFEGKTGEIVDSDRKRGPNGVQTVYEVKGEGIDDTDADSWATADELERVTAQRVKAEQVTEIKGPDGKVMFRIEKEYIQQYPGTRGKLTWFLDDAGGGNIVNGDESYVMKELDRLMDKHGIGKTTAAVFNESPEEIMAKLPEDRKENYLVEEGGDTVMVQMPKMTDEGSIDMFMDVSRQYLPDGLRDREIVAYRIKEDGILDEMPEEWVTEGAQEEEWNQWFRDLAKKRGLSEGAIVALIDWPDIGMVDYFDTGTDKYPWVLTLERKGGATTKTTAAAVKEPWEMTRDEFRKERAKKQKETLKFYPKKVRPLADYSRNPDLRLMIDKQHEDAVRSAFLGGEEVPPEVLADYPQIAKMKRRVNEDAVPATNTHMDMAASKQGKSPATAKLVKASLSKEEAEYEKKNGLSFEKYMENVEKTKGMMDPDDYGKPKEEHRADYEESLRKLMKEGWSATAKSKAPMTDETYAVYGDSEFYRTGDNFWFSDEGRLIPLTEDQADEIRGALGESTALLKTEEDKILSVRNLVKDLGLIKEKRQEMKRMATKAELQTTHGDRVEALTRNTLSLVNAVKAVYSGPVAAAMHPIADRVGQKARQVYNETHTNSWVTGTLQPLSRDPKSVRARITDLEREVRELKLPLGLANVMANRLKDELKSLKNAMDNL
jgi:hypothetical protein